jgi:serine/threonine-protein kinase
MWKAGDLVGGRYRLRDLIGSGGMSVVWRAHDEVLDRPVAVKALTQAGSERFRIRLRAEARAYGRLNTPRIAQVYDYGETDAATPYLVMEYVTGEPLSHRLCDGAMPWPAAIAIAAQIADALRDAHAHGLVHRDIKPENVILTDTGAKLVDFGICAMIGAPDADENGRLLGTPAYLAPERIADTPVQAAADVYGLGVLLYRVLTGALPWQADTSTGLLRAHMFAEPAPLPEIDGLPLEAAKICAACMHKDPRARPSSAELANTLWLAALTGTAPNSPAPGHIAPVAPVASVAPVAPVAPTSPARHGGSAGSAAGNRDGAVLVSRRMEQALTMTRPLVGPEHRTSKPSALWLPKRLDRRSAHFDTAVARQLNPPDHAQAQGRRRPRAYAFAAAVIAVSFALLGVAWGVLGRSDDAGSRQAVASPCLAKFTVDSDWGIGFSGHVTVTNASDVALRGWQVGFAFTGDQRLSNVGATGATGATGAAGGSAANVTVMPTEGKPYAAAIEQTGATVVARAPGSEALAVSQSVAVPINARYTGTNRVPTAVTLNGTDCQTRVSEAALRPEPTIAPAPAKTGMTTSTSGHDGARNSADGDGNGGNGTSDRDAGHAKGGGHGKAGGHDGSKHHSDG